MTEEFYIGQRVAIRGGGAVAPGHVVAISAECVTVERQRPAYEIGPLMTDARVRSRWHHDGDAFGRAGDALCAWIEPWSDEHAALLAAREPEGSPPYAEKHRGRGGIDHPRAPAAPAAVPEDLILALVLPRKPWP
jgi:hypothetical protein